MSPYFVLLKEADYDHEEKLVTYFCLNTGNPLVVGNSRGVWRHGNHGRKWNEWWRHHLRWNHQNCHRPAGERRGSHRWETSREWRTPGRRPGQCQPYYSRLYPGL